MAKVNTLDGTVTGGKLEGISIVMKSKGNLYQVGQNSETTCIILSKKENKNKINELKKLIDNILKNPKKLIEANQKLNKFSKKLDGFLNYKTPTVFLTDLLMERNLINKKGVTKAC